MYIFFSFTSANVLDFNSSEYKSVYLYLYLYINVPFYSFSRSVKGDPFYENVEVTFFHLIVKVPAFQALRFPILKYGVQSINRKVNSKSTAQQLFIHRLQLHVNALPHHMFLLVLLLYLFCFYVMWLPVNQAGLLLVLISSHYVYVIIIYWHNVRSGRWPMVLEAGREKDIRMMAQPAWQIQQLHQI